MTAGQLALDCDPNWPDDWEDDWPEDDDLIDPRDHDLKGQGIPARHLRRIVTVPLTGSWL